MDEKFYHKEKNMTVKELRKICDLAPDENAKVYIQGYDEEIRNTDVGYNFDDVCNLDLYVIYK